MFYSARLKLTAWYLLIIMIISIAFSAFIYIGATNELDRALRVQRFRIEHPLLQSYPPFNQRIVVAVPDLAVIEESKQRVLEGLIGINVIILIASTLAGYFLAGRTLIPIQKMVSEQKRFITDASHELNTPLTALRTGIEVTLRDSALSLSKAKAALTSNLEEVDNLQLLSDELIRLAMYEKPNGVLQFADVSMQKIVTTALQKVKTIGKQKNITFTTHLQDATVNGDEKSLTEVIIILLDNAIKYSPAKSTITVFVKKSDTNVTISVQDSGAGIDKKDIPHVFDRFYRADTSRTKQEISGYGLGLSIAKRIIHLHNGTMHVESKLNEGTTFTIALESTQSS